MHPQIDAFLSDLKTRRYSPNTITEYRRVLFALAATNPDKPDLSTLTPQDIRRYLASINHTSAGTKALALSAIRTFAKSFHDTNAPIYKASKAVRGPRYQRPLPKALQHDEINALIGLASRPTNALEHWQVARNRALILLLYGCGLRSNEATTLPFNTPVGVLRITGKGNKERLVPVLPVVARAVETYQRMYLAAHDGKAPEMLFPGFSDRDLRRVMQSYRETLGLPETASPHALRHSFATHLHQNGMDLVHLAGLMGHSSISTTAIYTNVDQRSLVGMLERCYPGAYGADVGANEMKGVA